MSDYGADCKLCCRLLLVFAIFRVPASANRKLSVKLRSYRIVIVSMLRFAK